MKTVIVNIPDNKENLLLNYFRKHHLKIRMVEAKEDEEKIAGWIEEGMESEEVSEEEILETLRKNGDKV